MEPIAIVGQACVLPQALSPAQLWANVLAGRDCVTSVPADRWGVPRASVMGTPDDPVDKTWTDAGGYVEGFESIFDPHGFRVSADEVLALDPIFQWTLHGAREALRDAGLDEHANTGLTLGGLAFPTSGLAAYADSVWVPSLPRPHARNRFSSGLPAHFAARALGLGAGAFALDAACASSLYAIKLACDRLQDGTADVMLAGAASRTDDLFTHIGFCALGALSRTGRSRPFHRDADGLVASEGAGFVVLMRLADAVAQKRTILGVIRGIGLSNDARRRNLLAPSEEGQERAIRAAYATAGLSPNDISLLECHATGTNVGDATELASTARVFEGCRDVPIGSLKSNLGHLVAAAGVAGLMKVLAAMQAGLRPPTLHIDEPLDAVRNTPFRLLREAEPWSGPRRAAISAFGFGGNNAHLIVESFDETPAPRVFVRAETPRIAIVSLGARVNGGANVHDFARALFEGAKQNAPRTSVEVALDGLRFPPRDLAHALPQQTLVLEAAREAVETLDLPRERNAVLIGMGCDPELARYGGRWKLATWAERWAANVGGSVDPEWLARARDAFQHGLEAAGVLGTMPNIVANRINTQIDAGGPGFVIASEEASGIAAMDTAARWLANGEIDAAVVGAVDLSHELVHQTALAELGHARQPGDAAVVLVLKRLEDAERDGNEVFAIVDRDGGTGEGLQLGDDGIDLAESFGHAHAANGLLHVAAGALALHHRAKLRGNAPATPWLDGEQSVDVAVSVLEAPPATARLTAHSVKPWQATAPPRISVESTKPVGGEIAFVFTGAGASYPGAGSELALAFPDLADAVRARCGNLAPAEGAEAIDHLTGSTFVSQLHAEITLRVLGIRPAATIGYSSGESNALVAMGAWNDLGAMFDESRAGTIFTRDLAGTFDAPRRAWERAGQPGTRWASVCITAPADAVRAALADEPQVHVTIINTRDECVIGGEDAAVARVVAKLGEERAFPLGYDFVAHCPEVGEVREEWRKLHRRETRDVECRFYTNATSSWFRATADAAADAITAQALTTLDFPRTVEQAWNDGVRIFIEHGPRALCANWIRRILGDREHLVVSLDGRPAIRQLLHAAATLAAAGVQLDIDALHARLAASAPPPFADRPHLTFPAHEPPPQLPPFTPVVQVMEPAPIWSAAALPPLLERAEPASGASESRGRAAALQLVAQAHQVFLEQQAAAHQQFLAMRQNTAAMLLRTAPTTTHAPRPIERPQPAGLPGPKFNRAQLEVLAGGRISHVFGPQFAEQDGYRRQVRMPEPPLLLADRVTGIDATPGSMGLGTLWTETDVRPDSWYLDPTGRMPAGIMIEAGQADLLLISWLGVDLINRNERVYRLLGCELTFLGPLCVPGDILAFDIHVDSHTQHDDVRLFFFHYDCHVNGKPRIRVRHAQAGFFTDQELAESAGVLWDPADERYEGNGPLDPPAVISTKRSFTADDVRAFANGEPLACFGRGWELTAAHVRTPRIASGRMQFLRDVTEFDPRGGPWGRGYLRAETPVTPDDWFFDGHFKNDPCMPGTLMFEGCLQAMAFYLGAMGFTIAHDGWFFEPVPDEKYVMRCRGQVTPSSRHLVYEVFVSEVSAGPLPTVFADLLCTVDGLKVFHARRVGLRLAPDWPLEHWKQLATPAEQLTGELVPLQTLGGLRGHVDAAAPASADGFAYGFASLLACAWGKPSVAFGPSYAKFDGPRRLPRLPGPPYHFVTRVMQIDAPMNVTKAGGVVETEYDIPAEQWYFEQNGTPTMPYCVLLEAALQPCGWLAMYAGSVLGAKGDMLFRNLDGTCTLFEEIKPGAGTLRTRVRLESVSQTPEMIIESFRVEGSIDGRRVLEMTAVFGFFPPEAFVDQVGLAVPAEERTRLNAPSNCSIDVAKYRESTPRLAGPMLRMLDRITAFDPNGGAKGLGYLRAEKTVRPGEWFFKAHFFQDPVQPGSLGIEAMCQLLQIYMIERGITGERFEPVMTGRAVTWTFRGQVVPTNGVITVDMEITEVGRGYAIADAWLWVDGKRIYHAKQLGMRVWSAALQTIDPAVDTWINDHCPTWTVPVLPMMSMIDRLAAAADGNVAAIEDVQLRRWLPFPGGAVHVKTEVKDDTVTLFAWRDAADAALSRFEPVATARVRAGAPPPAPRPFAPLDDLQPIDDVYAAGSMFHGPAFHYLTELKMGRSGSSGRLDAARGTVPYGRLHHGLLDAATHAIPHDSLWQWSDDVARDLAAYPHRIPEMRFHEPLPSSGEVRVEVRFAGLDETRRHPSFDIQILSGDGERVLVSFRLVGVLLPKGPIGSAPADARRAFLRDRRYVDGVALSSFDGTTTSVTAADVHQSDWLPGNVARIYNVAPSRRSVLAEEVAVREHVSRRAFVHPSAIEVEDDFAGARAHMRPLRRHPLQLTKSGDAIRVVDAAPPVQDLAPVHDYWRKRIGIGPWPIEDLYYGLAGRFVGDVVLTDPEAFARMQGRGCLYVGNHQVGIESLLFSVLTAALSKTPVVTLAKAEHRTSWLGWLIAHSFSYPNVTDPRLIMFFERDDREALLRIVGDIAAELQTRERSAMVHIEGTRSLACRRPVLKMSSAFIDMALAVDAPIVPVRFVGGLPVDELPRRIEFPFGFGRQDYWIGSPIFPEQLAALPYKERKTVIIDAMNGLGPDLMREEPHPPDPEFGALVEEWIAKTGASPEDAVFYTTLATLPEPGDEVRELLEGAESGRLVTRNEWLAQLAERLFGPRGPEVVRG